ncbi:UNVERIFIED_CONTAM: hypothetical protein FKN15_064990 [Acipenser sinensis]
MRLSGERTKGASVEAKQHKQHLGENEYLGLKKKEGQRATGQETPKRNHNEPHKKKHPIKEENKGEEEIKCAQLMFREDFLRDQYFGDDLLASIVTEEQHFGEGMHRKAFRTKVISGLMPVFNSGHTCVLKVHNAIAYGTKTNDELIQKNYNLAVQECHVQNTAREYIKEYRADIKCTKAFGEVPEIIPVYLIHRPANNIPYATLEEELVGDFVKYSVKDGKEMNMMRRESDAGQKCCTFQHWVYKKTDGNLLVTDLQGVGMKLTDVGIATCGKGSAMYKTQQENTLKNIELT